MTKQNRTQTPLDSSKQTPGLSPTSVSTPEPTPESVGTPSVLSPAQQSIGRRFSFLTTIRDDALDDDFDVVDESEMADATAVDTDAERVLAWLDGELDAEEVAQFQADLAASPKLQQMLKQFQRTANLVQSVTPEELNPKIAASTMEMVAVVAADELNARLRQERVRSVLTTLGVLLLLGAAVAGGYFLARTGTKSDEREIQTSMPTGDSLARETLKTPPPEHNSSWPNRTPFNNAPFNNAPFNNARNIRDFQNPENEGSPQEIPGPWPNPADDARGWDRQNFRKGEPDFGPPPFDRGPLSEKPFEMARNFLPEELRNENMESFQTSFDEFVQSRMEEFQKQGFKQDQKQDQKQEEKTEGKGPQGTRGGMKGDRNRFRGFRMIEEYIDSRSDEEIIAKLSPSAQAYMKTLPEKERRRYLGLILSIELLQRDQAREKGPFDRQGNREGNRGKDFYRGHMRDTEPLPPGLAKVNPGDDDAGFFWMTESTGDLAETLRSLPAERQAELLRLPSDEMYARLLSIHWGFDPTKSSGPFTVPGKPAPTPTGPIHPVP